MMTIDIDKALTKSAALYDLTMANGLVDAMRRLLDEGADNAFAEQVVTMQWASWVAARDNYLAQVREELEAFQRGDFEPTHH
jgi:hypothetical protein